MLSQNVFLIIKMKANSINRKVSENKKVLSGDNLCAKTNNITIFAVRFQQYYYTIHILLPDGVNSDHGMNSNNSERNCSIISISSPPPPPSLNYGGAHRIKTEIFDMRIDK